MQIKPIIAGAVAGAVVAAGGVAAFQVSAPTADAQGSGTVTRGEFNQLKADQAATDKRVIVGIKRANNAWNGDNRYTAPAGSTAPDLKSPKISQKPYLGGGYQPQQLNDDVQKNWPYWVKAYYNGTQMQWQGRGPVDTVREAVGVYRVVFPQGFNLAACNYTATPGYYPGGADPDKYARVQVYNGNAPNNVLVRTYEADKPGNADVTPKDYAWQGAIICNPAGQNGAAP